MTGTPPATMVVRGRIATLAGDDGPAWVEAIGIAGGRVVAAGSVGDVEAAAGPGARRMTLGRDEAAIPGLTDAHLHLVEAALAGTRVQLEDADSIDAFVGRIRANANGLGDGDAWIQG